MKNAKAKNATAPATVLASPSQEGVGPAAAARMSLSSRIRIELLFGLLTPTELAQRLGLDSSRGLHCYLHQLQKAKKDPVIRIGNRYVLKRRYTALQEWR